MSESDRNSGTSVFETREGILRGSMTMSFLLLFLKNLNIIVLFNYTLYIIKMSPLAKILLLVMITEKLIRIIYVIRAFDLH